MSRSAVVLATVVAVTFAGLFISPERALAGKYLVQGTGGPGPGSPEEGIALLERVVIPTFEMMMKWEKEGKMVGGLPTGSRAFTMIIEAESNHALDVMLRSIPAWPLLEWSVTPLETASDRAATERKIVQELKALKGK